MNMLAKGVSLQVWSSKVAWLTPPPPFFPPPPFVLLTLGFWGGGGFALLADGG